MPETQFSGTRWGTFAAKYTLLDFQKTADYDLIGEFSKFAFSMNMPISAQVLVTMKQINITTCDS